LTARADEHEQGETGNQPETMAKSFHWFRLCKPAGIVNGGMARRAGVDTYDHRFP
jgi:hypothetical protein